MLVHTTPSPCHNFPMSQSHSIIYTQGPFVHLCHPNALQMCNTTVPWLDRWVPHRDNLLHGRMQEMPGKTRFLLGRRGWRRRCRQGLDLKGSSRREETRSTKMSDCHTQEQTEEHTPVICVPICKVLLCFQAQPNVAANPSL